jgi:hypothetical protein
MIVVSKKLAKERLTAVLGKKIAELILQVIMGQKPTTKVGSS